MRKSGIDSEASGRLLHYASIEEAQNQQSQFEHHQLVMHNLQSSQVRLEIRFNCTENREVYIYIYIYIYIYSIMNVIFAP